MERRTRPADRRGRRSRVPALASRAPDRPPGLPTIRAAGASDEPALRELRREAEEAHAKILPDYFRVAGEHPPEVSPGEKAGGVFSAVLVAELGGTVCGYVAVRIVDTAKDPAVVARRRGQVETLVVARGVRRRGIGKALMRAAEDWARRRQAVEMVLTVWSANRPAEALYRDLGYGPLARVLRRKLA